MKNNDPSSNTCIYQFEIIHKSWSKRRRPVKEPQPVSAEIADFKLEEQHFCTMQVNYDDGSQQSFYSRVLRNPITQQWTVDGMQVAVRVIIVKTQIN